MNNMYCLRGVSAQFPQSTTIIVSTCMLANDPIERNSVTTLSYHMHACVHVCIGFPHQEHMQARLTMYKQPIVKAFKLRLGMQEAILGGKEDLL